MKVLRKKMMSNLQGLASALETGDVCLQECRDASGKRVFVISVRKKVGDKVETFLPIARMFTFERGDNPYADLTPPKDIADGADDEVPEASSIIFNPKKIITGKN